MCQPSANTRTGITLMEVLISIGILSIGLASVLALIPAGGNEARRALIADRRASLAANALADAVQYGILDTSKWSSVPASPYMIAVDPLGAAVFPDVPVSQKVEVITVGALNALAAPAVFLGADDLAYQQPDDLELPVVPIYTSGQRPATGAFSWLATLLPVGVTSPDIYRLSIVTFHLRPVPPAISGPLAATGLAGSRSVQVTGGLPLAVDAFRETFTRGAPILLAAPSATPVWRTIVAPLPQTTGTVVTSAELLLDADVPFTAGSVYVYPGAVGIAEKLVTLEGVSPWSL